MALRGPIWYHAGMANEAYTRRNRPLAVIVIVATLALAGLVLVYLPAKERQQPVSPDEQVQLSRQIQINSEALNAMMTEKLSTESLVDERARENDDTGRALYVRCVQWTDLADATQTDSALKNQELACRRYSHYVATGELLDEPNNDQR